MVAPTKLDFAVWVSKLHLRRSASSREGLAALEQPPLCLAVGQRVLPSFRPCVFPSFRLVVVTVFSQLVAHSIGRAALLSRAAFLSIVEAPPRSPSSSNAEDPYDYERASSPAQVANKTAVSQVTLKEVVLDAKDGGVGRGEYVG